MSNEHVEWVGQKELGTDLGVSSIEVGKLLTSAGLRDPGTKAPTDRAVGLGVVSEPLTGKDGSSSYTYFRWRASAVLPLLRQVQRSAGRAQPSLEERVSDLERRIRDIEAGASQGMPRRR